MWGVEGQVEGVLDGVPWAPVVSAPGWVPEKCHRLGMELGHFMGFLASLGKAEYTFEHGRQPIRYYT